MIREETMFDIGKKQLFFALWVLLITPIASQATTKLPIMVQLDQYLIASKKFIEEKNFALSLEQLELAKQLETSLPAEFYYLYGKSLKGTGQDQSAKVELHQYLSLIERNGPHYEEALLELVDIQASIAEESKGDELLNGDHISSSKSDPIIKSSASSKYGDHLSKFYLTKDKKRALLVHINDVLKSYSVQRFPIEEGPSGRYKPGVRAYNSSIELSKGTILSRTVINDKWKNSGSLTRMESSQLDVYGIGPDIDYTCHQGLCELLNPTNGKALVYFLPDPYAIEELQTAFMHLVKILQKE